MKYLVVILFSYVIGSSSMSFYLGKLNGVSINKEGSKNLGASNTMVLLGWKAGIIVALHDILKAILVVLLARYLYGNLFAIGEVAGVSCILGHIFPFYLKFKGGKGFASYVGMTLALDWKFALVLILIIALVVLISDYIVSGTFSTMVLVPIYLGIMNHSYIIFGILCIASIVMLFKHKENVIRLANGTEVGLRSANRGEHRIK